jgi:GT2 family glycosyltransferase
MTPGATRPTSGAGADVGPAESASAPLDRGSPAARPDVEVLIVAFGAPGLLDSCLAALDAQFPVIVVDNSSDPAVRDVAQRHGAAYHDPGANLGFAGGVNSGITCLGRPEADLLLLNPDAEIGPDGIRQLERCLHVGSRRSCVAPAQTDPKGGKPAKVAWPYPTPLGAWAEAVGLGRLRRGNRFMIGSILLLSADALTEVGGFDERFFLYAEETDWQLRASKLGWTSVLCPEVVATHVGAGTGGDRKARYIRFHASKERYIRKHYGTSGWWIFRTGVMAGSMVRSLVLGGRRGRAAADRFHTYRVGPCRAESGLVTGGRGQAPTPA